MYHNSKKQGAAVPTPTAVPTVVPTVDAVPADNRPGSPAVRPK
jgi:hypothetical protein